MSDRNTWPLALSVRPETMNAAAFKELAEAGIFHIELSSGSIDPYYSMIDFPHRSKEITKLAAQSGVTISSIHLPFGPFAEIDPASVDLSVRSRFLLVQTELLEAASRAEIGLAIVHPSVSQEPVFLLNSRLGLFAAASFEAPLLPKLRGHFAEFLNNASSVGLRILSSSTCVGLRYGLI